MADNKDTFTDACQFFNSQDWAHLKPLLDTNVRVIYLNPKTKETFTSDDFISYQKNKPQVETFVADYQNWNASTTGVVGFGRWTDQNKKVINIAFGFTFDDAGKINFMWGAPV